MKAFIGGTLLIASNYFTDWSKRTVKTPFGVAPVLISGDFLFLQRHGDPPLPPHMINHRANIAALRQYGIDEILSFNSVGSLKKSIRPGTFIIPDDFISLWEVPTFYDRTIHFTVPSLSTSLRNKLLVACEKWGLKTKNGGVYFQTRGPRLETPAEIKMLKGFAHIVGMTMASEATLCSECGIEYAALCSVDNFCNGISETPLTVDEITQNANLSRSSIEKVIGKCM